MLIPAHLLWDSLSSQLHVFVMLLTATFFCRYSHTDLKFYLTCALIQYTVAAVSYSKLFSATVPALHQVHIVDNRELWRKTQHVMLCKYITQLLQTAHYIILNSLIIQLPNEVCTSLHAFQCLMHHVFIRITIMDYLMLP